MGKETGTMLFVALAVVAVGYLMTRQSGGAVSVAAAASKVGGAMSRPGSPEQIMNNALPGQPGFGWDYYKGGVAIGPDGTYYLNGSPVWAP